MPLVKGGIAPLAIRPGLNHPRQGTGRLPPPSDAPVAERMRHKLRTAEGRAVYKIRKAVVEPVFGQIKEQQVAHSCPLTVRFVLENAMERN